MSKEIHRSHNVSHLLYHLVCPVKYRNKAFSVTGTHEVLKQTCIELEKRYDIFFLEIGLDNDHVHFLIQSVPMINPSRIAQIVKSITAREIFLKKPEVKTMLWGGQFWSKGYYINTVGASGHEVAITNYVKNQGKDNYQQIYSA